MELPQRRAVSDSEESNADVDSVLVHLALDIDGHGRGALVKEGEARLVEEQASHTNALLLTT